MLQSPKSSRVLAFGATALVGVALRRRNDVTVVHCVAPSDERRAAAGQLTVRVEDAAEVAALLDRLRPDAILYCHAVCDVGRCEEDPAWAHEINVGGVHNLLRAVGRDTRVVYVSSDHVFGNDGVYAESCPPTPISVYGRTRVLAEEAVLRHPAALVVRPGLGVGPSLNGRTGHMDWLRYRSARGLPITIVEDEARSAVWTDALAERLVQFARASVGGIRNIAASRMVSRPELARHLMSLHSLAPRFHLTRRADRPFPHLGRVELRSDFHDALARPLPSVVDGGDYKLLAATNA
jgi:dTDP-4-dehydrorhamnose reductase